tara:strand:- start:498 stop:1898 length:1401 start_codon:yes stop_codon:yes gene_type:complete
MSDLKRKPLLGPALDTFRAVWEAEIAAGGKSADVKAAGLANEDQHALDELNAARLAANNKAKAGIDGAARHRLYREYLADPVGAVSRYGPIEAWDVYQPEKEDMGKRHSARLQGVYREYLADPVGAASRYGPIEAWDGYQPEEENMGKRHSALMQQALLVPLPASDSSSEDEDTDMEDDDAMDTTNHGGSVDIEAAIANVTRRLDALEPWKTAEAAVIDQKYLLKLDEKGTENKQFSETQLRQQLHWELSDLQSRYETCRAKLTNDLKMHLETREFKSLASATNSPTHASHDGSALQPHATHGAPSVAAKARAKARANAKALVRSRGMAFGQAQARIESQGGAPSRGGAFGHVAADPPAAKEMAKEMAVAAAKAKARVRANAAGTTLNDDDGDNLRKALLNGNLDRPTYHYGYVTPADGGRPKRVQAEWTGKHVEPVLRPARRAFEPPEGGFGAFPRENQDLPSPH